jgi:hypothetical protein
MSDSAVQLVALVKSPSSIAAFVLADLAKSGIIEALPTDSALGALAHRPGPKLTAVEKLGPTFVDFREMAVNGFEVRLCSPPELFVPGDEMPILACPKCGAAMNSARAPPGGRFTCEYKRLAHVMTAQRLIVIASN